MGVMRGTEPTNISLVDLMVIIAGIALGCAMEPISPGWRLVGEMNDVVRWQFTSLHETARHPILVIAFSTAAAILVRRFRYGGMPRTGEWPALVLGASLLSGAVLRWAYEVAMPRGTLMGVGAPPDESRLWRPDTWLWGVSWSIAGLIFLALLVMLRRALPPWAKTIGITALVWMLLCGPIHVYFKQCHGAFPRLLTPAPHSPAEIWWYQIRFSLWVDGSRWPELLLVGVPTVGALLDLRRHGRPPWTWTQWAGLGLVMALAASWWLDRANPFDAGNPDRTANVAFRGAMLVAVGIASWVVVRIFGEGWKRWVNREPDASPRGRGVSAARDPSR
jgi:hypothetical protein